MGYKRFLISILGLFGLISFCNAQTTGVKNTIKSESTRATTTINTYDGFSNSYTNNEQILFNSPSDCSTSLYSLCFTANGNRNLLYYQGVAEVEFLANGGQYCSVIGGNNCDGPLVSTVNSTLTYTISVNKIYDSVYDSATCQSEYSLMPISSCNSEYCEMNDLCSTIGGSGSSTLYINDIWHESAPFIYVNIPEEFKWDYFTGEQEFTINVDGYNTDADYIAGIINTQKSKPTNDDLQNIFFGLVPLLFPGLVFFLFLYFAFKFIKKIF